MTQYQNTIGINHHRTADVCHRVAQHYIRHGELKAVRTLIDQALKVWSTNEQVYKPELARTSFLKARVLFQQGDKRALELFRDAVRLRTSIPKVKSKPDRDLEEKDFDDLVTFWSR